MVADRVTATASAAATVTSLLVRVAVMPCCLAVSLDSYRCCLRHTAATAANAVLRARLKT